jgi:hypothetical protein
MNSDFEQCSIEEIEGAVWREYDYETDLVRKCHLLRKKPVGSFTTEDLRVMILQDIGTAILVPRAILVLRSNPLAEGNHYEGDLLSCVMNGVPTQFWTDNPEQAESIYGITLRALGILKEEAEDDVISNLESEIHQFWGRLREGKGV